VNDSTLALLTDLLGAACIAALFFAALAGAWLLGRHSQRQAAAAKEPFLTDLGAQKMAEVMNRIDELSLELERSSEGQRYLAKMLTGEQRDAMARAKELMRAPERVVTPH
jgi:hypothetical protein